MDEHSLSRPVFSEFSGCTSSRVEGLGCTGSSARISQAPPSRVRTESTPGPGSSVTCSDQRPAGFRFEPDDLPMADGCHIDSYSGLPGTEHSAEQESNHAESPNFHECETPSSVLRALNGCRGERCQSRGRVVRAAAFGRQSARMSSSRLTAGWMLIAAFSCANNGSLMAGRSIWLSASK